MNPETIIYIHFVIFSAPGAYLMVSDAIENIKELV